MSYHHNHRHRRGRGTVDTLLLIFIVVLSCALGGMLYYDHVQEQERAEELRIIDQQKRAERQAQEAEREQRRINDSFYQKLADGFDVNVLIVGDSIGEGAGASDANHRWANLLQYNLQKSYGVKVNLTNVSMGGNASYAGYVRTMALNDGADYDLVVLCYGQNDGKNNFSLYYSELPKSGTLNGKYNFNKLQKVLELHTFLLAKHSKMCYNF